MKAYSLLTLKSLDDEQRILSGTATTPACDLAGDVVEPRGAVFSLPLPFLFQHDHQQPIGHVTKADVSSTGIRVEVKIAKITEPGRLKDRIDEAWQSIRAGLVRGMSIGFSAIESTRIATGIRYLKWSWHELSAVTVPAQSEATIATVKHYDGRSLADLRSRKGVPLITAGRGAPLLSLDKHPGAVRLITGR